MLRSTGVSTPIVSCRSCAGTRLRTVLDLGEQPIANALVAEDDSTNPDPVYPLAVAFCQDCALLQVTETIPADVLFGRDYPYFSSSSPTLLRHAAEHADGLIKSRSLGPDSFVIEIASNDGYLLKNFVARGIPCLGIDPATGPARQAMASGVPTLTKFFSLDLARQLRAEGRQADVMIANNVVAHVDGINDFVAGFAALLKPTGTAVFEFAYALDMIEHCEFDTIYHEHLFYHSLHSFGALVERHGLHLNDAEPLAIHGGSLRVWTGFGRERTPRLEALIARERSLGVHKLGFYESFAQQVRQTTATLKETLRSLKAGGHRIAAYGAAAKGATLANYLKLGRGFFDYVVDRNPHKHGKYMPGERIPILPPSRLLEDRRPDYLLLFAWNFADEIIRDQAEYLAAAGTILVPLPELRIVEVKEDIGIFAEHVQPGQRDCETTVNKITETLDNPKVEQASKERISP